MVTLQKIYRVIPKKNIQTVTIKGSELLASAIKNGNGSATTCANSWK
jgi:hypothetical protein